jgi:phage gpG-like protein
MINISITGDRELAIHLDAITRELPLAFKRIVGRSALEVKRLTLLNLSGLVLNVRSGKLRSSIQIALGGTPTNPWATIGTNTIYARIQELGGIIRAKNRPYLVFRINTAVKIYSKSKTVKVGGSKYEFGGNRLKNNQNIYSWVRVKQVTIPPRPFLKTAMEAALPAINRIAEEEIGRAVA